MCKIGDLVYLKSNKEEKMVICDNECTCRWINSDREVKTIELTCELVKIIEKHTSDISIKIGDIVKHKSNRDLNLTVSEISDEISCTWIKDDEQKMQEFELQELTK